MNIPVNEIKIRFPSINITSLQDFFNACEKQSTFYYFSPSGKDIIICNESGSIVGHIRINIQDKKIEIKLHESYKYFDYVKLPLDWSISQ